MIREAEYCRSLHCHKIMLLSHAKRVRAHHFSNGKGMTAL
ncbi:hypothetical protein FHS19_001465 [Paenibacillus rhizosphaerae]|uniref:Uncharacterized protein n=1 Tax=Paenibacillus rhizosphaerae TaxID=297318 RepID=A0A839TJG1_9BACL|nr:hypothetical protein [Paenibacillus rhizosphaerae]